MAEPAAPTTAPPTGMPPTPAPQTAAPQAGDGGPGNAAFGLLADGGFVARLGAGLRLAAEDLSSPEGVDLTTLPQPVPGVRLNKAKWSARRNSLEVDASLQVPQLEAADFRINVNREGKPSFALRSLRKQLEIAALGNPQVALSLSEEGEFGGSVTIAPSNLIPRGLRSLTVTGGGILTIQGGRFAGNVDATLAYANLGDGEVHFAVNEAGRITGTGVLRVTPPFLNQVAADLALSEDGNLSGTVTVAMTEAVSPIPALSLTGGTLTVSYANGAVAGSLTDFQAAYRGLADLTASLSIANGTFSGQGNLALTVPGLNEASGTIRVRNGAVSGSIALAASAFPQALPIKSGRITASLTEDGRIGFAGNVSVELGPAGAGQLAAAYSEAGELAIAATIDLTIPGLQGAQVSVAYANGDISGEAQVPIDPSLIPGLSGSATVRYQQGLWSGETEIAYSADRGKLSGRITVTVVQTEAGALQLGGSGEVEAQIAPRLRGMLTATILPEGGVDVSGRITVSEPLELFPEAKFDKELFKYSQNVPLWAILVAVIRVRAGIRGGVGAGVFRNIMVEGSYTIGNDEADPTFSISGEMFIPAYVEAYVAFGAGLGLDVVLGSLTGGIEGVATAGIYGAVSVVPELSYADGDWSIEGDAVLAAGARLKIGLNAWAEIEALWVTVWEETWQLGEWVWNVGPDLGLKAHMAYRFGQPGPPEIEFNASDIDTESMIQAAIPEDGPAPSGAREALQNKAEWKGKLKEQKPAPVPPDLAAQSQAAPPAPPKPAQQPKPKRTPPAGGPPGGPITAPGGTAEVPEPPKTIQDIATKEQQKGAVAPQGDVRQRVKEALASKLKAGSTHEEARTIVAEIEREYKLFGLKTLEIGPENEEGTSAILAEASRKLPLAELMRQVPKPKGRSVVSRVQLTLSVPADIPTTELQPLAPAKATVPRAGVVWTPSVRASTSLNIVTWNTSDVDPPGNQSHAEHQFVTYLEDRPDLLANVEKIVIRNDRRSPCSICAPELANLLRKIKEARPGRPVEADIYWTKLHSTGAQPTSWQSLFYMQQEGWNLHAPGNELPPEEGGQYADRVMVKLL